MSLVQDIKLQHYARDTVRGYTPPVEGQNETKIPTFAR